jgi:predicted PurR-regulated permease PerM
MTASTEDPVQTRSFQGGQTIAIRIIAGILIAVALHFLSAICVPFLLALTVAVALSPTANWLERKGCPRTLASLCGLIGVALILCTAVGLILYQAGSMSRDSDRYIKGFSQSLESGAKMIGLEGLLAASSSDESARDDANKTSSSGESAREDSDETRNLSRFLRDNARTASTWALRGVGGLAGVAGEAVLFLAFLFYMLQTRSDWIERITTAGRRVGLKPDARHLETVRREVGTYVKTLFFVSLGYTVLITLALWALGVPQPLLWGVMTGLLEVIPYFGPFIAGALPTFASLGTGESLWQPLAVIGLFVVLQTVEGYVVAPLLYGNAVKIDPVTVLFGVLFFGILWGPFGLALAMPTMILLRGLIAISPETPALDALVSE